MSATRAICPSTVLARCSGGAPTGSPCLPFRMARDAVAHFERQVEPLPAVLEHVDDAQALLVVAEAAGHEPIDDALPGVTERRMAEVVAEGDGFRQFLVQPQHLGDAAGDLRHLERVRQPRAVVIAGRREEDLGLVLEPPEGLGVNDAVAIALKHRPDGIGRLGAETAAAGGALRGLGGQELELPWLPAVRGWQT